MKRSPQLSLRLDADAPDPDAPWRAGGRIAYLGGFLTLVLDTACPTPERLGTELHLPLPPAATPRQVRDAAESWLRDEALAVFGRIVAERSDISATGPAAAENSALVARQNASVSSAPLLPKIVLVFGKRVDWVRCEGESLRCHWRLIEQSPAIIERVLAQALAVFRHTSASDDLFALT
jgi:hypothetical protein